MCRTILMAAALAIALSFQASAQDDAAAKMKMAEKKMALKSVTCDPTCGFSVRSHDEQELISIVQAHAKTHHNQAMSEADVRKMMKEEMMEKKEMKMEKKEMKEESGDDD